MKRPSPDSTPPAGIYIHVPFCRAKCPYCDFYSTTRMQRIPDYLQALNEEIRLYRGHVESADTIYFGGGTPSLLTPRQIDGLIDAVRTTFQMADDAEITLETNPGTLTRESLQGYRSAGVNRLNIGIQSLDDDALRFLGRIHTAGQGRDAFHWARDAGFDNLGLDLIYGLPGQTRAQWASQLASAAGFQAEHLSCYTLTLEPGTPLAAGIETGQIDAPDEAIVADLFTHTVQWLNANGYRQYEISNFAIDPTAGGVDRRSRHNRKYWTFAPYLGFGPEAHSYAAGRRWWNHRSLDRYLIDLSNGRQPVKERETLTRDQQLIEFIYLGLRQTRGIDLSEYRRRFDDDFLAANGDRCRTLVDEGLLVRQAGCIRLTVQGMRYLESVAGRLLG